jgi:hypothetical protein
MVHTVQILSYTPRGQSPGRLVFELDGRTFHACCLADAREADGLLAAGRSYPVTLLVEAETPVEYAAAGEPGLAVTQSREEGDRVEVLGRTWDSVSHQVIHLESRPSVGVKLSPPQTATDYRGGSWLKARGVLCADLPPEEHA